MRIRLADLLQRLSPRLMDAAGETTEVVQDLDSTVSAVKVDRELIEQSMLQLASNARAAMPSGGRLSITLREAKVKADELTDAVLPAEAGTFALIEVNDNGAGIEGLRLHEIFDPFYSTQSLAKAPGLGLAIVHGVIASHNGGITVSSTPGRGTTIRLYLPIDPEPGSA
jgi:signal transduction histidine kinase